MGLVGEMVAQLEEDVAPHRLVSRGVGVVVLAHHVAPQVRGQAGNGPFRGGHRCVSVASILGTGAADGNSLNTDVLVAFPTFG
jgi:hypothetical protein